MNSLLSGHVCIYYTPNCTNKIAFSTPTLYLVYHYFRVDITSTMVDFTSKLHYVIFDHDYHQDRLQMRRYHRKQHMPTTLTSYQRPTHTSVSFWHLQRTSSTSGTWKSMFLKRNGSGCTLNQFQKQQCTVVKSNGEAPGLWALCLALHKMWHAWLVFLLWHLVEWRRSGFGGNIYKLTPWYDSTTHTFFLSSRTILAAQASLRHWKTPWIRSIASNFGICLVYSTLVSCRVMTCMSLLTLSQYPLWQSERDGVCLDASYASHHRHQAIKQWLHTHQWRTLWGTGGELQGPV